MALVTTNGTEFVGTISIENNDIVITDDDGLQAIRISLFNAESHALARQLEESKRIEHECSV